MAGKRQGTASKFFLRQEAKMDSNDDHTPANALHRSLMLSMQVAPKIENDVNWSRHLQVMAAQTPHHLLALGLSNRDSESWLLGMCTE